MTRALHTVSVDPDHLRELFDTLRAALEDDGDAVWPRARAAGGAAAEQPEHDGAVGPAQTTTVPDDVVVVVETSGSTGSPRAVMLSAGALRAAAAASAARLGGPGQWLLTLPPVHVAGLQVLVRSILDGTTPVLGTPGGFRPDAFAADTARMTADRRYVSLVPTQLHRLLVDAGPGLAALTTFDAVLLGGAAASSQLLDQASAAGVRITTTYGMSETCGGCVYDGVPLDGVQVRLDDAGRIHLAGPMLATGYLGRPDLDALTFVTGSATPGSASPGSAASGGERWLRTTDLGRLDGDRLVVLGRADDVLITGGVNVAAAAVERLLTQLPGVVQACVVGLPDTEWGQAVTAVLVIDPGADTPTLETLRAYVTRTLGAPAAPRHLVVTDLLPVRGPGKTDRRAVAELAAARLT